MFVPGQTHFLGNVLEKAHEKTLVQIHSTVTIRPLTPFPPCTLLSALAVLINTESDHPPFCSVTSAQLIPAGGFNKSAGAEFRSRVKPQKVVF